MTWKAWSQLVAGCAGAVLLGVILWVVVPILLAWSIFFGLLFGFASSVACLAGCAYVCGTAYYAIKNKKYNGGRYDTLDVNENGFVQVAVDRETWKYIHAENSQVPWPDHLTLGSGRGGQKQLQSGTQVQEVVGGLPTNVLYEDVRHQVPRNHVLVGVGRTGVETKDRAVGACVWICGLSGTGKTSTTVLRVEERFSGGHVFLGIDPHYFKPDSLTNAVASYDSSFVMPMAKTTEETTEVLNAFLAEFQARKSGRSPRPWTKVTLLVDEVNSLMDATNKQEEANADLLKSIARICGQEARNFNMGGIFISQQATGLSWLRKVALMVIIHQLLMESEKNIACNGDKAVMEEMKRWPIGRTYVYGVGFGADGPRVVQQPYFEPPVVDADGWQVETDGDVETVGNDTGNSWKQPVEPVRDNVSAFPGNFFDGGNGEKNFSETGNAETDVPHGMAQEDLRQLFDRYQKGDNLRDIAKDMHLGGRNYWKFQDLCRYLGIPLKQEA